MGQSESKLKSRAFKSIRLDVGSNGAFKKVIKDIKKCDLNLLVDSNGSTLLNVASELGRKSIMIELLKYGCNPNISNNEGITPLHHCVINCEEELVTLLLRNGANPNTISKNSATPLITAIQRGDDKMVEVLFSDYFAKQKELERISNSKRANSDKNEKDSIVNSSFSGASSSNNNGSGNNIINSIGNNNSSNNILNNSGGSTTTIVASSITTNGGGSGYYHTNTNGSGSGGANVESIDTDVNLCDNLGTSPLMWASSEGNLIIVKLLLNMGADINKRDTQGRTAILIAKQKGHNNIISLLNEKFCKVNKIILNNNSNNNNNNNSKNNSKNNSNNNYLASGSSNLHYASHLVQSQPINSPQLNTATDSLASSWSSSDSGLNQINQVENSNNNSSGGSNNNHSNNNIDRVNNNNNNNINTNCNINNNINMNLNNLKVTGSLQSIASSSSKDESTCCKVCWERPSDVVLLWCGHYVICFYCSQFLQYCPVCIQKIDKVQKVYLA